MNNLYKMTEEQIEERIIEKHDNPLITDKMRERMEAVVKIKETIELSY